MKVGLLLKQIRNLDCGLEVHIGREIDSSEIVPLTVVQLADAEDHNVEGKHGKIVVLWP